MQLGSLTGWRRRFELRSIVCGFIRSRSLRPECDPTIRSGDSRTRLHPRHIPSWIRRLIQQPPRGAPQSPALMISRATVPQARAVSIILTSGTAAVLDHNRPDPGATSDWLLTAGEEHHATPFQCNRSSACHTDVGSPDEQSSVDIGIVRCSSMFSSGQPTQAVASVSAADRRRRRLRSCSGCAR